MKWILFILLPILTFSQFPIKEEKKINIDSLLQTEEYEGIEIEKHTVKKGERMRNIFMKYKITPGEIYRLNPEAKDSLKVGSILLIPLQKKVVYREWLNPKWVAQNEEKLKNQIKNKQESKSIISKKVETKKVETPLVKVDPKVVAKNAQDSIVKKNRDDFYAMLDKEKIDQKIKDSLALITNDDISNKKEKKKKKTKKEIVYGSPDDHDVFLDPKNKENYVLHEIEEGETLTSIALKYKVPVFALLEFNKRVDFNKVLAGNLMKVPNIKNENVQSYIFDLIAAYKTKNIKYDKDVTKKEFNYTNEEENENENK